jgi:hypothetical protein
MYEEEEIDESKLTETQRAMLAAKRKQQAEDEKWFEEYMVEVAEKREQEAAELEELKARIEERRAQRIEEDEQRQEYARQAAERHKQEEEEKKAKLEEAKRKKQAAREKKQAMMAGGMGNVGAAPPKGAGRSFKIVKKQVQAEDGTVTEVEEKVDAAGGPDPHKEALMAKYKQPLDLDDADCTSLRMRIKGLHEQLLHAESARYDLEERVKVQNMDFKELNERNKQQLKKKAQKLGLDPEEFANAKHPPKVKTQNAYDRVIDSRGYEDRKKYYLRQPPPPKAIAHGTARPPPQWGRTYNAEEIQNVRKYLEENPPKYQELEPVEGAKPPVKPIPLKVPEETAEAPPPADEPAAPEPAAAEPAPEAEAEAE